MKYLIEEKPSLNELMHFGVKGMHWGQRKSKDTLPLHSSYQAHQQAHDQKTRSKGAVERINADLHKGMSIQKARSNEDDRASAKATKRAIYTTAAVYAAWRLRPYVKQAANLAARSIINHQMAKAGARAAANMLADTHGITNYSTINLAFNEAENLWG